MSGCRREAGFFGPQGLLFGVYEEPRGPLRHTGVVLCYPFGQEYIRAHRTFVILGEKLASQGFPALRFDFLGCGDSEGDVEAHSLHRWRADLDVAVNELRTVTGVRSVALVGLRLGGTVALSWTAEQRDISALVLWEPVLDGPEHMAALRRDHREYLTSLGVDPGAEREQRAMLGFELAPQLELDILGLNSKALLAGFRGARRSALLAQMSDTAMRNVAAEIERLGIRSVELLDTRTEPIWMKADGANAELVPKNSLDTLLRWLSHNCK